MTDKEADTGNKDKGAGENKDDKGTPTGDSGKVATPDYEKRFSELQGTISTQGDTIKELQEAVVAASIISTTIASDPTLKKNFEDQLRKQYGGLPTDQQDKGGNQDKPNNDNKGTPSTTPEIERDIKEVKDANRDSIINDFEKNSGILTMPEDKRKEARGKIETYLRGFGWSVNTLPLTTLRESLDKAYVGTVGIETAKEEGKVEALSAYRNNEKAVMGNFGSANINSEESETLTNEQNKWLKNLHVDPEKAKKVYAEREKEKEREKPIK